MAATRYSIWAAKYVPPEQRLGDGACYQGPVGRDGGGGKDEKDSEVDSAEYNVDGNEDTEPPSEPDMDGQSERGGGGANTKYSATYNKKWAKLRRRDARHEHNRERKMASKPASRSASDTSASARAARIVGSVTWYNYKLGYGRVTWMEKRSAYVHFSDIHGERGCDRKLESGDAIEFSVIKGGKNGRGDWKAIDVTAPGGVTIDTARQEE